MVYTCLILLQFWLAHRGRSLQLTGIQALIVYLQWLAGKRTVAILWLCSARGKYMPAARWLFLIGTVLFCGTLYLKAIAGWDAVVRLAPFGGVSFMLGWLVIALEHCGSTAGKDA